MKISQIKGGAALSYATIFITNIVGLLLTPFIIRTLGSDEYGLYTMIGALVGYMTVLDFGLNNTVIRFVAKYRAENDRASEENFLAHSFIMFFFISLLIIILGGILYFNFENLYSDTMGFEQIKKAKTMMLILIFNLAFSLPGGAFMGICYGYEQFILPKVANIIRYILRSILVVVILLMGAKSVGLVILDTVLNLIGILFFMYYTFKILQVKIKLHYFDKKLLVTILGFSFWLFVFAIVHQLRWQFGQLIIGLYYSTSIVAIYAVGITLGNYYGAFSSAIESVFLPRAIQMTVKNEPRKELTDMFIKISRIILFILLYILGAFIILGKDFVYYWVGNEYYMAYYYALTIMIGLTPTLSQGFANNILEAKNLLAYRGRLLLSLTITGVIIGVFVVKTFGVEEMILVTVFFILLERLIMIPYYINKADLDMLRYYKEIAPLFLSLTIAITMAIINHYLLPNKNIAVFVSNAFVFSVLYFVFCTMVTSSYEKQLFKSTLSKIPVFKTFFKP